MRRLRVLGPGVAVLRRRVVGKAPDDLVFTFKDGSKAAITGSHNFVNGGALLGTREVALETRDAKIIEQLESFIHTHGA